MKISNPYTPEQLEGRFIVCFVLMSGKRPVMDCARYNAGPKSGMPYLYNSIDSAKSDLYFDPVNDEVIPASEYFERITQKEKSVF